eukprot:GHRQ01021029.1.p1 GENE.GHRQ01021029.1~~GHRQ01021029.1.p1  ORF type:complete len:235 (-),score=27.19 GHRQ01021029.1:121-825(-)
MSTTVCCVSFHLQEGHDSMSSRPPALPAHEQYACVPVRYTLPLVVTGFPSIIIFASLLRTLCVPWLLHARVRQGGQADKDKLFNGKQLTTSAASAYKLSAPFALWGILVVTLYAVSYAQFDTVKEHMAISKLMQRSLAQASRLTYFAARASLEEVGCAASLQLLAAGRVDAVGCSVSKQVYMMCAHSHDTCVPCVHMVCLCFLCLHMCAWSSAITSILSLMPTVLCNMDSAATC